MKFKLDENGRIVTENGVPIVIHDDGKEGPYDVLAKIGELNSESASRRHKITEQEKELEAQKKAADAWKALGETPEAVKAKIEAAGKAGKGGDEELKKLREENASLSAQLEPMKSQVETLTQEKDTLSNDVFGLTVGNAFASSKFIAEKLRMPADFVEARFGSNFKVETKDGARVIVPYYPDGKTPIFSKNPNNGGQYASVDEALEILVGQHPRGQEMLKSGGGGSGAGGGSEGGGAKTRYGEREWNDKLMTATPEDRSKLERDLLAGRVQVDLNT
jgi:hypothetical protein